MTTDFLSNEKVVLKKLTKNDANFFYDLYSSPELLINFDDSPFLLNETPQHFTERIISVSEFIWTIRLTDNPEIVIGDCACTIGIKKMTKLKLAVLSCQNIGDKEL